MNPLNTYLDHTLLKADAKSADRPPATKALPPPAERSKLSVDFVDMA